MTKPITPTLVICAAAALVTGLALARPGDPPTASSAPPATVYPSDAGAQDDQDDQSGRNDGDGEDAAPTIEAASIEIVDFDFAGDLSVAAGQTINVTNADGAPHTLSAVDGGFDTSVIDSGGIGRITAPSSAGTYDFFCAIHPSMTATLTVTP